MKNFPQNNTRFNIARKRLRGPAGPRRLGTATHMSASLFRRLSAFLGSTSNQDPKTAKFAALTPGPGMFVNVQFVSRIMIAPHPKCHLFRRVSRCVRFFEQRRVCTRFRVRKRTWAACAGGVEVRVTNALESVVWLRFLRFCGFSEGEKESRRKALALFVPMPIHSSPQCELPQGFAGFGN